LIWRYDLTSVGPSATEVRLTYDWSAVAQPLREQIGFPPFGREHLTVVVLGPHAAAAMLGRERADNDGAPDDDRRFDFVVTYDQSLVTLAARNLLDRMI
jgi:hypothetical protein